MFQGGDGFGIVRAAGDQSVTAISSRYHRIRDADGAYFTRRLVFLFIIKTFGPINSSRSLRGLSCQLKAERVIECNPSTATRDCPKQVPTGVKVLMTKSVLHTRAPEGNVKQECSSSRKQL